MAPADPPASPAPSRRALRATGSVGTLEPEEAPATARAVTGHPALTWVDPAALTTTTHLDTTAHLDTPAPDLLGRPPRRSPLRPSVLLPLALMLLVAGAYSATTLLWPLHEVAPTVEPVGVQPVAAPAAAPAWPTVGSAAISVTGIPGDLSTTADPQTIASITKIVTALVVLDEQPLSIGEQGPDYLFTARDRTMYWQYRENGESAVDVPVGDNLTQYQMLEAMLIGSGNNYADRLASGLWPTDAVFATAANTWLRTHGVTGVTVAEPTGLDERNVATPASLLVLAQKALANPVIAEIVAKTSVDLPGVGLIENTNGMLADPGIIGVKTGTLDTWNLLTAKNLTIGDTTVRVYASVLGQPDNDSRLAATRALYTQLEAELQPQTAVPAGTTVGRVTTAWGEDVAIVSTADASLIMWNAELPEASSEFSLGDLRATGDEVGALTLTTALGRSVVPLALDGDIEDPSPWWRLTHPLELFGLND